jgi:hypothetical protein
LLCVLAILFVIGCGTADANLHVTYASNGDVQAQLTIKGTGAIGNLLLSPDTRDNLTKQDWTVTTQVNGDTTTLVATAVRKPGEPVQVLAGSTAGGSLIDKMAINESPGLFKKGYAVSFKTTPQKPATPPANTGQSSLIDEKQMAQLMDTMFRFSLSITLPGQIVETNADNVQGDTATWYFTYSGMQSERQITVRTEQILWANIAAAGFALLVVVSTLGYVLMRRRVPSYHTSPA